MSEKTFLVEIGTEELPPKALRKLGEEFFTNIVSGLNAEKLLFTILITVLGLPLRDV